MKKLIAGMTLTLALAVGVFAADDIDGAYTEFKTATDAKKVPDMVTAAKAIYGFAAKTPDDAHNKEVVESTDYGLYAMSLAVSPAEEVQLMQTLEAGSPKSKYLATGYGHYLASLGKVAPGQVNAVVTKALTNFPDSQELLVAGANAAMGAQQAGRAAQLANKALASKPPKPEGVDQAAWDKAQSAIAASMHWTIGVAAGSQNQFQECINQLKIAAPQVSGSTQGIAYFYLGLCTYQIGRQIQDKNRILEGAKYSDQSAAIASPMQQRAAANSTTMKAEAAKMR